jgi:branched-chain amino acid transport system permease protein
MADAHASALDAEPRLRKAARTTVGDRLMLALRPPGLSSGPLRWLGLAMLALALIFPLIGGPFYTRLGIETLLLGAVAVSVDILLGYAGLLSLGQAAYFGLAAYISALMYLHVTRSFWLVLLTVMAAVGVFSLVLGAVAIRAKGVYFALITFGAAEILSKIAHNTRAIGGSDGLLGIPIPSIALFPGIALDLHSNLVFYYAVLAALVLIYVGTRRVLATAFGSVLRAIRDNSDRVPYLGYNPFWYKLMAYVMAAQIAAFGGLVYPLLRGFVAPNLFGFEVSTQAVVMSLVGGVGTLLGPLVGSAIITFLESLIGSYTDRHLMVLGVIFIVFVMYLPDGLCGLAQRAFIAFSGEVDTGSPQKTRQTQESSRRKAWP